MVTYFFSMALSTSFIALKDSMNVVVVDDVSTDFISEGVNLLGVLGFIMAFFSLWFTFVTYRAQKKTEKHTMNAPKSAQIGKLRDLSRHFYRNLVCASAMIFKYLDASNNDDEGKRKNYPSESNLLKLKTLPDEVIYDIDEDAKSYTKRHEFKLLLRNFNTEVDVASEHFARMNISDKAIRQDIDNLIFKQLYLVYRSYELRQLLDNTEPLDIVAESLYEIIKEHFYKLYDGAKLKSNTANWSYIDKFLKDQRPIDVFKERIDLKQGVLRSYDNHIVSFVKNQLSDATVRVFDNGFLFSKDEKKEIIVNKNKFIDFLKKEILKSKMPPQGRIVRWFERFICSEKNVKDPDFVAFVRCVTSISGFDDFKTFCANEKSIDSETYSKISVYLDFLNKEEWDFRSLLFLMLIVDCMLELDKIGMVNFDS